MIVDHLPTGSVFSFLWNLLISISFQFVGFLLTYLLHTTHAARCGSRAGLGVTLIQYGFALRSRPEEDQNGWWGGSGAYGNGPQEDAPAKPTFSTKEEAEDYYRKLNITMVNGMPSGTVPGATMDDMAVANEATTYWLSFFLMTIGTFPFFLSFFFLSDGGRNDSLCVFFFSGWFILLTSMLKFWHVKRYERNVLASQREMSVSGRDAAGQSSSHAFSTRIHRFMGAPVRDMSSLLLTGLGLSRRFRGANPEGGGDDHDLDRAVPMTPLPVPPEESSRRELIIAMYAHDPDRQRQIIQAFRDDDRLMADMRAAGML